MAGRGWLFHEFPRDSSRWPPRAAVVGPGTSLAADDARVRPGLGYYNSSLAPVNFEPGGRIEALPGKCASLIPE
jgi:hypothetical protein